MSRSITIAYELNPPAQTSAEGLERERTLTFPVQAVKPGEGEICKHYADVRKAIAAARDAIGDDLTAWRDAVGSLEQFKEPRTSKKDEEENEEEEAEETEE